MLIDTGGQPIQEDWHYLGDQDWQLQAGTIAPLAVVAAAASVGYLPRPIGALVSSDVSAERLEPYLGGLDIVVVEFPQMHDGQCFVMARALRELGYEGELRAVGHFVAEQLAALTECGFSSIMTISGDVVAA